MIILVLKYLFGVTVSKYAVNGVPGVNIRLSLFNSYMKVSPGSNYGVGGPAEDEECNMDDGHF